MDRRNCFETGITARFIFFVLRKNLAKKHGHKKRGVYTDAAKPKDAGKFDVATQKKIVSTAWSLAEPLCAAEGMELIHAECRREPGGRILRLYIDRPGGVTIADCAAISRQLGDLLDCKLETEVAYMLEVSSPGVERPVSRPADFEKFTGKTARIRTTTPINGRKNFTGALSGVMGDGVHLQMETETVLIPFHEISTARLVNDNGDGKC
jgi:ribosome maturation factor RimP